MGDNRRIFFFIIIAGVFDFETETSASNFHATTHVTDEGPSDYNPQSQGLMLVTLHVHYAVRPVTSMLWVRRAGNLYSRFCAFYFLKFVVPLGSWH